VHIIESPRSSDRRARTAEGPALAEALRLYGIGVTLHDVRTQPAFKAAFHDIADWHAKRRRGRTPIVHISAHGDENGIQLTSGADIGWARIAERLRSLKEDCRMRPILAMSSCEGFAAKQMAETSAKGSPFKWLVGSTGKPGWQKTLIAFSTLYYQLTCGVEPVPAAKAMGAASLHRRFQIFLG
jgi:hypothetical protein